MSLNCCYYGIKEADYKYSYMKAQWLTSYELINKLKIKSLANLNLSSLDQNDLVYPNELVFSDNNQSILVDILLLAKYTDKYGNLKLKSVLLSHLIKNLNQSSDQILILSLQKDSYYWCDVSNVPKNAHHMIPKFALRVGYDQFVKQFSYIGRMKASNLFKSQSSIESVRNHIGDILPQMAESITHKINNLIGTLTHIYEYIPTIVLKLHDLSYLEIDKKILNNLNNQYQQFEQNFLEHHQDLFHDLFIWSKLNDAINSKVIDFNMMSLAANYEVLCLKKQPATLKQLCKMRLIKLEEETFESIKLDHFCYDLTKKRNKANYEVNKSLRTLPNSVRNLLWPSFLEPGQCIDKNGSMRSSNGVYELNINKDGALRFIKLIKIHDLNDGQDSNENYYYLKQVTTFEKNVESLMVSKHGVYLIYDNKQATRKPNLIYKHTQFSGAIDNNNNINNISCTYLNPNDDKYGHFQNLFDISSLKTSFLFELSDNGFLRVIVQQKMIKKNKSFANNIIMNQSYNSSKLILINNLINLNDHFASINNNSNFLINPTSRPFASSTLKASIRKLSKSSSEIELSDQASTLATSFHNEPESFRSISIINVRLVARLNDITHLPIRIIHVVIDLIRSVVQRLIYRSYYMTASNAHLN